jgi:hypothetical protein
MLLATQFAAADDDTSWIDGHKGQTVVEIDGRIKWLDKDQISGVPWWLVKVKYYHGDQLVREAQVQAWDGFTGVSEGSGTTGVRNPFTGTYRPRTRIDYFAFLDSRRPDPYMVLGQNAQFQDVFAQVQAFTLESLTLYVYAEGADRFEAEVYSSRTAGYSIDWSQLVPLAKQNDDPPLGLFGKLSGNLKPRTGPLYVHRELEGFPVIVDGAHKWMQFRPDGTWELIDGKVAGPK